MRKQISLINAPQGAIVKVIRFDGSYELHDRHRGFARHHEFSHLWQSHSSPHDRYTSYVRRLEEMGILPQETLTVTRNSLIGPVEVIVKGSRLVIGRGIASKIIVEVVGE